MNYRPTGAPTQTSAHAACAGLRFDATAFLTRLARMSAAERLYKSRYEFNHRQLWTWAQHYTDEVPVVNGEFEFIALRASDVGG